MTTPPSVIVSLSTVSLAFLSLSAIGEERYVRKPLQHPKNLQTDTGCPQSREAGAGQPTLKMIDEAAGRYAIRWLGADGKAKEIIYTCPALVGVVIEASVSEENGKFRYEYRISSQPTSKQEVYGVALQTFAAHVRVLYPSDDRYIGPMHKSIPEFRDGVWYRVPFSSGELSPGHTQRILLESDAPPGLVNVRAHGPVGMMGVGEEMPGELEAQLPRYEVWPVGITIGPVSDHPTGTYEFSRLSPEELIQTMSRAGWIGTETADRYVKATKSPVARSGLSAQVERDVQANLVAPEVLQAVRRFEHAR